jgi:hypothetical protein
LNFELVDFVNEPTPSSRKLRGEEAKHFRKARGAKDVSSARMKPHMALDCEMENGIEMEGYKYSPTEVREAETAKGWCLFSAMQREDFLHRCPGSMEKRDLPVRWRVFRQGKDVSGAIKRVG